MFESDTTVIFKIYIFRTIGKEHKKLLTFEVRTSQLKVPEYRIYHDEAVTAAADSGKIPTELVHRLVRGTIHCMNSISYVHPFNRCPSSGELEEMAKSITHEYPCFIRSRNKTCIYIFIFI